ncbi:hypothetical protein [Brevibacterium oceani]|uniref:hypothetical protein n=1 Tax=Brevibacterium oceani TaxID=358099 RepID=UPI0015E77670|nr:hypothetical protein [Brevibacterium oceani]
MHEHQPDENLADFTNEEVLQLIDSGTVGAFSEIYRRRIDDVANEKSIPRAIHDVALLAVLKQVLDSPPLTSEGLEALIESAVEEETVRHDVTEELSNVSTSWERHSNVANVFSSLPDNWQRILWLREVEDFTPTTVAQRLNVTVHTATRLTVRARQEMKRQWRKTQGESAPSATELRAALIPALLISPILIERFADTLNDRSQAHMASSVPTAATAAESISTPEADGEASSESAAEAAEDSGAAEDEVAEEDSGVEKGDSLFHLPKPVLIPVAAACIGLLGSLVGLSISPITSENSGYRTDVGPSSASAGKEAGSQGGSVSEHSPSSGHSSDDGHAGSYSPNSPNPHDPAASQDVGGDRSGPPASRGAGDRTDGKSSSGKRAGDRPGTPDESGSEEPGVPDRPNPTKPDSPTPSEPDEPDAPSPSEPDEPNEPAPSDPDEPSDPAPSDPDEPDAPSPSGPEEPSDPAPSDPDEPNDPEPSEPDGADSASSTSVQSDGEGSVGANEGGDSSSKTTARRSSR